MVNHHHEDHEDTKSLENENFAFVFFVSLVVNLFFHFQQRFALPVNLARQPLSHLGHKAT
jgi:hypothetical protein